MFFLETPIEKIKYFGPAASKKLAKLKIKTVRDLLYHFPYRYDNFSEYIPIADVKPNSQSTVRGTIVNVKNIRIFRRHMTLTEITVEDGGSAIKSVWFNQPYLLNQFKLGRVINLSGKAALFKKHLCFSNPAYEIINYGDNGARRLADKKEALHTGRLVPVYPETYGLTSRWLRLGIKSILRFSNRIPDVLPVEIKKNYHLPNLDFALSQIHFPEKIEQAELAKKRFAFEELFILQLFMGLERLKLSKQSAPKIEFKEALIKKFVDSLPFKLTDDQRKVSWQIIKDIGCSRPMNRLLEGDVGSGKTIVAALAAYLTALNGLQTAFMAPTEILSRQHFEKIQAIFQEYEIPIGLLTSSEARIDRKKIVKKNLLKEVENGNVKILIGTHSLIQKNVCFKNLALVVIDEQHRFGVSQRAALADHYKETIPHLLSMSATPIPRTLGLTIWGDLDLSLIKEMPKGRGVITTKIIPPDKRQLTYEFVKSEIKKGRQGFVICPRIEPPSKPLPPKKEIEQDNLLSWKIYDAKKEQILEIKSVKSEYEKLLKIFPEFKIAMLHGKMMSKEKESVMGDFVNGKVDILISTSVVEVGIDVPNASIMIIEGAGGFGLAQLYQFRGRIGRGKYDSFCLLFIEDAKEDARRPGLTNQRLQALVSAKSGLELAEKDLEIRGPGDFTGVRQSGLPDLAIASLGDLKLIEETREAAKKILTADSSLQRYPLLLNRLSEFRNRIHLE